MGRGVPIATSATNTWVTLLVVMLPWACTNKRENHDTLTKAKCKVNLEILSVNPEFLQFNMRYSLTANKESLWAAGACSVQPHSAEQRLQAYRLCEELPLRLERKDGTYDANGTWTVTVPLKREVWQPTTAIDVYEVTVLLSVQENGSPIVFDRARVLHFLRPTQQ